jgi:hypothetical protein
MCKLLALLNELHLTAQYEKHYNIQEQVSCTKTRKKVHVNIYLQTLLF